MFIIMNGKGEYWDVIDGRLVVYNNELELLYCYTNQIIFLCGPRGEMILPKGLRELSCGNNQITSLCGPRGEMIFNEGLEVLNCWSNQITSICGLNGKKILPKGLKRLECIDNPIQIRDSIRIRRIRRIKERVWCEEKLKLWSIEIIF